jgi:sorting nexin-25
LTIYGHVLSLSSTTAVWLQVRMNLSLALIVIPALVALPFLTRSILPTWLFLLVWSSTAVLLTFALILAPIAIGYLLDSKTPARRRSHYTARPLAFSTPAAWQAVITRSQWTQGLGRPTFKPLHSSSPPVSDAIEDVINMIIRDFVLVWYNGISSSKCFPNAVNATIHASLERLLERLQGVDLPNLIVKRILPKITAHVEQFRLSEVALRGATLERRLTQSDQLDLLLASRYAGKGRLHPAVGNLSSAFTKQTEEMHLKRLVEQVLPFILPGPEVGSESVQIVVREIVACSILFPVVEMLSDPDFWNKIIDSMVSPRIVWYQL